MINIWCRRIALLLALVPLSAVADELGKPTLDAKALVTGALELTRGDSSYSELTMQIQRPGWQKTLKMVAWTRGTEDALIRVTAPAKDAGQATLKKGDQMWTFIPKFKKSMRLPSSMMSTVGGSLIFRTMIYRDQIHCCGITIFRSLKWKKKTTIRFIPSTPFHMMMRRSFGARSAW